MPISISVATDVANAALTYYVRGKAFLQTIQEKPLIAALSAKKKTFPGGKDNVSYPIQGAFMSDTSGFFAGYTASDTLTFTQAQNLLRAAYAWKELHAGLVITETELKMDGISVNDSMKTSEHSEVELTRLTGVLQNRLEDYGESWAREFNEMLWSDGSQDSKAVPGVMALLTESEATGTVGGLSKATYAWWRSRLVLGINPSDQNQTLSKKLRSELRLLRRYGGRPSVALAGSAFLEALESEVQEKGIYTQEGFKSEGKTDLGMADITMRGLGRFQYDPTLDDLGWSKYCYIIDPKHLILSPMEGEENKIRTPERPYDQFVFLRSMTWTGALGVNQLNAHGVYSVV